MAGGTQGELPLACTMKDSRQQGKGARVGGTRWNRHHRRAGTGKGHAYSKLGQVTARAELAAQPMWLWSIPLFSFIEEISHTLLSNFKIVYSPLFYQPRLLFCG
jgi:hypothetical protein